MSQSLFTSMISRFLISVTLGLGLTFPITSLSAQDEAPSGPKAAPDTSTPGLLGHIEKSIYFSPTNMFRIQVPVMGELGGATTDADNGVVTFQDNLSTHVSIGCFAMDATQRWNDETNGRKDYLMAFFADIVRRDFAQRFQGTKIESAKFRSSLMDGSIIAYVLLPGGSMFSDHTMSAEGETPLVAKRGNLLFVKDEHVYVISVELAEKVLEHSSWDKTPAQEDAILETRLLEILSKMSFTKAAPAATSGPQSNTTSPDSASQSK